LTFFSFFFQSSTTYLNMTEVLNATSTAFQDGSLNGLTLLQGEHIQLLTLTSCVDDDCEGQGFTVGAPADTSLRNPLSWNGGSILHFCLPLLVVALVVGVSN
jgi:hypothetical protein